jgi:DNA ligase-1
VELHELVATSHEVAATRSRTAKTDALAEAVAGLADEELAAGLAFLAGHPRQDRLGAGWATVGSTDVPSVDEPSLTVLDVDRALDEVAALEGEGSQGDREAALAELFARATADEQAWLTAMLLREVRQGASDSLVQTAVAQATGVGVRAVQRAVALCDDVARVALAARHGGEEGLAEVSLEPLRFAQPMLAQTGADVEDVVVELGDAVVDTKLDGARVQVHRVRDEVRVFTRNGNDVTHRLGEVVAVARSLGADPVVLDGEAIAIDQSGAPRGFGDTMGRFGSDEDSPVRVEGGADLPLSVFFFDVLLAGERDLVEVPLRERLAVLDEVVPAEHVVPRWSGSDPAAALAFTRDVLEQRHEGVMVKDPDSPYVAGSRGKAWRKVKPVHTLDLVVLAAEWGSGRRRGWLSNLHLGAYDASADDWVMLGKTFKGLTDEMLRWQTERLLELEERRTKHVVHVRPRLVVEVALDGFLPSPRYPAGIAMRFARVKHHRPDKDPRQADTVATCRAIFEGRQRPTL